MKEWKKKVQNCLPDVEAFLSATLKIEDGELSILSEQTVAVDKAKKEMGVRDIFLRLETADPPMDVILILDKSWYGILSSRMLGVEQSSQNEVTRDLLEKFSGELFTIVNRHTGSGKDGEKPNIEVLTRAAVRKKLAHQQYYAVEFGVGGLGDQPVRVELLLGDPEQQTEPKDAKKKGKSGSEKKKASKKMPKKADGKEPATETDESFSRLEADEMARLGEEQAEIHGSRVEFEELDEENGTATGEQARSMDLLQDVEMDVSVELGRIELPLGKVLSLTKGSVIELERLAGEPVDILVNGHHIAYGEVVVIDEHFGVRVSSLITTRQRLAQIQ